MFKIFIIQDNFNINTLLKKNIEQHGYTVIIANDFLNIQNHFCDISPDLLMINTKLPFFDGLYWCKKVRDVSACPILFIGVGDCKTLQLQALEAGADDYLCEPLDHEVVIAKIRSHLRRVYGAYSVMQRERVLFYGSMVLYPERFLLMVDKEKIELSKKEMMLLEILFQYSFRIVSRESLLSKLWDDKKFIDENTLNVCITRMRKKLRYVGMDGCIETVRGIGYRLRIR